jgi:hypothetical protein
MTTQTQNSTTMQTVKDTLYNDTTNIYSIEDGIQRLPVQNDAENYYFSPLLSFGDYDNSCAVERSNVRTFMEQHEESRGIDWIHLSGAYGYECIAIKLLSTNEEIIECLAALSDYPVMDDEDVSSIEMEMESEAWDNWIERDFKNKVVKHYSAWDSEADSDTLRELFSQLKEKTNTYGQVESGGNYYIDLDRLIAGLPEIAPENLLLDYND